MRPQSQKSQPVDGDPAGVGAQTFELLRNLADANDLSSVAEMLKAIAEADGCAIALREGDDVVCRGRAGVAPQLGTKVDPSSGVTGECLRTGNTIRCDDTALDPRLSGSPVRSLVAVAVHGERNVAGVITVLSLVPQAFDIMTVVAIKDVASAIADFREGRTPAPEPEPEAAPEPPRPVIVLPSPPKATVETPAPPDPAMEEIRAIFQKTNGKAKSAAPAIAAAPARAKYEEPAPAPKPRAPEPVPFSTLGSYAPAEDEPSSLAGIGAVLKRGPEFAFANRQRTIIVIAALLLIVAATIWATRRNSAPEAQPEVAVETQPITPAAVSTEAVPAPQPADTQIAATTPPKEETAAKKAESRVEEDEEAEPEVKPMQIGSQQRVPAQTTVAELQAPVIAGGSAVPAVPRMAFGNSNVKLAAPTSKLLPAQIVSMIRPARPSSYKPNDAGSVVVVRATVDTEGQVSKVDILRGSPHLVLSAVAAVRRWKFQPATLNGKPIESTTEVTVKF